YKPVDRKVRPVSTFFPEPSAQQYKRIPLPSIEPLAISSPSRFTFVPTERLTQERFNGLMATIPEVFLSSEELDLIASVVIRREQAFAWEFSEKGTFKSEFYPDYEIATIEHTPWQKPPIHVPKALEREVRAEIRDQEANGRFEPTTSSYRSALFAVMKKSGK
ncbi:hypothetical protein OF83DRAFT_1032019, partial [Amylostereum chailletii]